MIKSVKMINLLTFSQPSRSGIADHTQYILKLWSAIADIYITISQVSAFADHSQCILKLCQQLLTHTSKHLMGQQLLTILSVYQNYGQHLLT